MMSSRRNKTSAFRHYAFMHFARCQWCNVELEFNQTTVDHVTSLGRGGIDAWENLALSCLPCNNRKGTKDWGRPRFGPTVWYPPKRRKETLWPATLTYSINFNVQTTERAF